MGREAERLMRWKRGDLGLEWDGEHVELTRTFTNDEPDRIVLDAQEVKWFCRFLWAHEADIHAAAEAVCRRQWSTMGREPCTHEWRQYDGDNDMCTRCGLFALREWDGDPPDDEV